MTRTTPINIWAAETSKAWRDIKSAETAIRNAAIEEAARVVKDGRCVQCGRAFNEKLEQENAKLREALEKIAYPPDDIDAPHYPVSIARAALQKDACR